MIIKDLLNSLINNVTYLKAKREILTGNNLNLMIPECNLLRASMHRACSEIILMKLQTGEYYLELGEDDSNQPLSVPDIINILIKVNQPHAEVWLPPGHTIKKVYIDYNSYYDRLEIKAD